MARYRRKFPRRLGAKMREVRKRLGMTQEALAKNMGRTQDRSHDLKQGSGILRYWRSWHSQN
jgi:transcriptional regulator with XRE-family HTH domain